VHLLTVLGPVIYGVTEQSAKDYTTRFPEGLNVPISDNPNGRTVHLAVSWRFSAKPNLAKRRIDKAILQRIALNVQHYELRALAQFLSPKAAAVGWMAHGFDVINLRWGQNKIKNEDGVTILAGNNSVIWATIMPSSPSTIATSSGNTTPR
jgi:hypothetical protein